MVTEQHRIVVLLDLPGNGGKVFVTISFINRSLFAYRKSA